MTKTLIQLHDKGTLQTIQRDIGCHEESHPPNQHHLRSNRHPPQDLLFSLPSSLPPSPFSLSSLSLSLSPRALRLSLSPHPVILLLPSPRHLSLFFISLFVVFSLSSSTCSLNL